MRAEAINWHGTRADFHTPNSGSPRETIIFLQASRDDRPAADWSIPRYQFLKTTRKGALMKRSLLKACTAWVAVGAILNPIGPFSVGLGRYRWDLGAGADAGDVRPAPRAPRRRAPGRAAPLTLQQKIALLQQKVKYVFVLFQENRSFDHYFGTYPGANGLFVDLSRRAGIRYLRAAGQHVRQLQLGHPRHRRQLHRRSRRS